MSLTRPSGSPRCEPGYKICICCHVFRGLGLEADHDLLGLVAHEMSEGVGQLAVEAFLVGDVERTDRGKADFPDPVQAGAKAGS